MFIFSLPLKTILSFIFQKRTNHILSVPTVTHSRRPVPLTASWQDQESCLCRGPDEAPRGGPNSGASGTTGPAEVRMPRAALKNKYLYPQQDFRKEEPSLRWTLMSKWRGSGARLPEILIVEDLLKFFFYQRLRPTHFRFQRLGAEPRWRDGSKGPRGDANQNYCLQSHILPFKGGTKDTKMLF